MAKTPLAWLIIYFIGCLAAFINPYYGLLTYIFEYFNHPPMHWWGKYLPHLRWSLTVALVTFIAMFVKRKFPQMINNVIQNSQFKWLILLLINMAIITYLNAVSIKESERYLIMFLKLVILFLMITTLINTKKEYQLFIWLIILGCFLFGWNATMNPKLTHGRLENVGGPDTRTANFLALLMIVPLPFIGLYFFIGKRWEKILSIIIAPFILNTIILCSSRGAFLALIVAAIYMLFFYRGKTRLSKKKIIFALTLGIMLFFYLTDERFWDRMKSLTQVEDTESAAKVSSERLDAWIGALKLMKDHPLGTGGGGYDLLSPIYIPEIIASHRGQLRTVHNTYLLVGSDWGIQGLILFLGFLGSTFLKLRRVRKKLGENDIRLYAESVAIECALVGILTGSIFVNRLYAESIYWLCGLAFVLEKIAHEYKK